jgi:sirohydrochlorin ferrochelatase
LVAAYHSDVDLPAILDDAVPHYPGLTIEQAPVLGPDPLLIAALNRRIREIGVWPGDPDVGVVVAAAGSRAESAIRSINEVAAQWASTGWAAVAAGFASAASPTVAEAVAALRDRGIGKVVIASHLVAPGRFADSLFSAGADAVAPPLGNAPEIVRLILERAAGVGRICASRELISSRPS